MSADQEKTVSRSVWNFVKILLALVLVGFVLSKTDFKELISLRGNIQSFWLAGVFLLYYLLTLLKALQYYFFLDRQVDYSKVLHVVVIQNAVSNFIAAGAGIASYLALFKVEHDVKISRSALAFILTKVGDFISIWLLLFVSSLTIWNQIPVYHLAVKLVLGSIGAVVLVFFTTIVLRHNFISLIRAVLEWLRLDHLSFVSKGTDFLQALVDQPQVFIFRVIGLGTMFSMVYMLVTMSWLYASFRAFSLQIEWMVTVFVNSLLQLISYLPIQVMGGLGVNEGAVLYLYGAFDVSQVRLATVLIGSRVLFYLANLIPLLYLPLYSCFSQKSPRSSK